MNWLGDEGERIIEQLGAPFDTLGEPDLERPDPVERRSVAALDELVQTDGVAHLRHGDEAVADVGVAERHDARLAPAHPRRPGAGEAVGLLLGVDRRQAAVELAGPRLDRMAELVGEHDPDRARPVLPGELGEQPVVAVVVDDEVALAAVERHELLDVLVGGAGLAATRQVVGAVRVRGVHPAAQRLEGIAVDRRVLL